MKDKKTILLFILLIIAAAALIVFEFVEITYTDDKVINDLINQIIPRAVTGGALAVVAVFLGYKSIFALRVKGLAKNLIWCIPCILVVLANFPFSALIMGTATVVRTELILLFIINCIFIGIMEEILFRGLLFNVIAEQFRNRPYGTILSVAVSSAVFGLIHLVNLFSGANVGATFLQVGYSFLIGAMLCAVLIKTENIWICIILHAAFDVGGFLIPTLGSGAFQDICFWILTAVCGFICFVHVLLFLLNKDKPKQTTEEQTETPSD